MLIGHKSTFILFFNAVDISVGKLFPHSLRKQFCPSMHLSFTLGAPFFCASSPFELYIGFNVYIYIYICMYMCLYL